MLAEVFVRVIDFQLCFEGALLALLLFYTGKSLLALIAFAKCALRAYCMYLTLGWTPVRKWLFLEVLGSAFCLSETDSNVTAWDVCFDTQWIVKWDCLKLHAQFMIFSLYMKGSIRGNFNVYCSQKVLRFPFCEVIFMLPKKAEKIVRFGILSVDSFS